jgi:LppX_LprAFG lipoprotein
MRGRRIALALALLGSVVALSGCSFTKAVDPVADAATKTENGGGAKLALTASVTTPAGETYSLSATGVLDKQQGDVTVSLPESNSQAELRYLEENGDLVLYVNSPALSSRLPGDKPWIRLDLQQLGQKLGVDVGKLLGGANQNPGQILDLLQSTGSVKQVGTESIDGTSTTHYTATVELDQLAGKLGGSVGQVAYDELVSKGAPSTIPVDVWVGADGFVRRATLDDSLTVSGQTASLKFQLDVSDYGTPVNVTAPPSDQVFDVSGLLSSFVH